MRNLLSKAINVLKMLYQTIGFKTYWFYRDLRYGMLSRGKEDLLNRMMVAGHILEKGITMPNRRYGFGYGTVRLIIDFCYRCINQYGTEYDQLQFAIDDLREYKKIHDDNKFELPKDIIDSIDELMQYKTIFDTNCKEFSKNDFFRDTNDFRDFALSRHTSRYFSHQPVPKELVVKAVELAKTAPSACNSQSIKIVVATGETKNKVLKVQNGHRGFGDTIDKMIVVVSEQIAWTENFRTSAFLDGGLFTMNLLYALHYYKICACTLNAHLSVKEYRNIRNILGLKDSEIVICFIGIGMPQERMMIAKSSRKQTKNLISFR